MNQHGPRATVLQTACFNSFCISADISTGEGIRTLKTTLLRRVRIPFRHSCLEYLRRGSNPQKTRILSPAHIPILLQRHMSRPATRAAASRSNRRCVSPKCETADKPRYQRDSSSDIPRSTPEGIRTLTVPDLGRLPLPIGITGA